jgi:hypothetical protein
MAPLSFTQRLPLALSSLFRILFNGQYAAQVHALDQAPISNPAPIANLATTSAPVAPSAPIAPTAPVAPVAPVTVVTSAASVDSALQLLSLLQREARFIDFTQENVANYSDADIGAAARVVHAGCRKVLQEHVSLEAIRSESEGSRITLNAGFDSHANRLTGNVVGNAPYTGTLAHAGWRASSVNLPQLAPGMDARILAAAEVEL